MKRPLIWNLQDPEFYDERDDEQERPKHKFIGTIIDKSYYQFYEIKDKYNHLHSFKICRICNEPIDLGFRKDDNSGFAGTLPHICEKFKEFLPLRKKGLFTQIDLERFIPELEWGQFIFIPAKEETE